MAGAPISGGSGGRAFAGLKLPLLAPALVTIGVFLLIPVGLMAVYSFLTKDFRGGVIWEFSLAAYDQFFLDRGPVRGRPADDQLGLYGDLPALDLAGGAGHAALPRHRLSRRPSSSRRGPTAPRRSGCFW
jgi:ABC-type sugar transport system permease subunit